MLELAQPKDREAVDALARQVHSLHMAWRPDVFAQTDCLYPEDRFLEAIRNRSLYVAKLGGEVAGYALLPIVEIDVPAMTRRRIMKVEELCVEESCRGQGHDGGYSGSGQSLPLPGCGASGISSESAGPGILSGLRLSNSERVHEPPGVTEYALFPRSQRLRGKKCLTYCATHYIMDLHSNVR